MNPLAPDIPDEILIRFAPPADPISMNQGDDWSVRKGAKEWRDAAYFQWVRAHPGVGPSGRAFHAPARVQVALPFKVKRRRDPINFAKTVKHIVDGFVMAGAWPDDTPEYVEQCIPTLIIGDEVVVRVTYEEES